MPSHDTSIRGKQQPWWPQVPPALLSAGLSPMELRVMIALLSFAEPRRPGKEVWPSLRTLASLVGLADTRSGRNKVSAAIGTLASRGYLENRTQPGRALRVSLKPFYTVYPHPCQVIPPPKSGDSPSPKSGADPHPDRDAPQNQPDEETKRTDQTDQTTPSAPPASSGGMATQSDRNGERPRETHPDRDADEMHSAYQNAKPHGVTVKAFVEIVNTRPDLSAEEINCSVCKWGERVGGTPEHPDKSLAAWVRRERGYRTGPTPPHMSGDDLPDDWQVDGSMSEREKASARRRRKSAASGRNVW